MSRTLAPGRHEAFLRKYSLLDLQCLSGSVKGLAVAGLAGRGRVIRQLLTESVLLSVMGGGLGILFAMVGAHAIVAFVSTGSSQTLGFEAGLDMRVLVFTAAIALLTGMIFGLAPAMRGARVDLAPALKDGVRYGVDARHRWLSAGNLLVIGQVALTMVVLVGTGLVVRTLQNLRNVNPGFDTSNVLNFNINPMLVGYRGAKLEQLYRDLQRRLGALPGVSSVSFSDEMLLNNGLMTTDLRLANGSGQSSVESDSLEVGPGYFATMKVPFVEGRDFLPAEYGVSSSEKRVSAATSASVSKDASSGARAATPASATPVVINETFVKRYLGGSNPLGARFWNAYSGPDSPGFAVVGVVGDMKYSDLRREIAPGMFVPVTSGDSFELRTAANPESIIPAVRGVVNEVDSNLPISNVITESESVDRTLFEERLIARFSSFFGALALALACIGLYGLLSYQVTRRSREIGIRVALGAGRGNILRNIVGQGLGLSLTGLILGIAASFGLTRFLGSILYDVQPGDPATLIVVTAILLLVALLACYIPARRAMRVDPMVALRHE
jgi:predicted permease